MHVPMPMHMCIIIHRVCGMGTRDLCGPPGLTTEAFIDLVAAHLNNDPDAVPLVKAGAKTAMFNDER